jgi:hypothetical protein
MQVELTKPRERGFHMLYQPDEPNRCLACGRSHWLVGRVSAECGFCSAALPIACRGEPHHRYAAAA